MRAPFASAAGALPAHLTMDLKNALKYSPPTSRGFGLTFTLSLNDVTSPWKKPPPGL